MNQIPESRLKIFHKNIFQCYLFFFIITKHYLVTEPISTGDFCGTTTCCILQPENRWL